MHWHRLPKTHRLALGFLPTVPSTLLTMKNQPPAPQPSLRPVVPAYPPCYRLLRRGRGSAVNVALRLISLCPPAFPLIHFAPRTQTVRKSSFVRNPTASNPIQKFPSCGPFVFMVLRIAFPANLLYSNTSALPTGCAPQTLFRSTTTSTCRPSSSILFIINQLRTLVLSCRSFPHSHALFSITCRLFVQKQGGGGTPPSSLCSPLSDLCVSVFPGRLCATQRSLRLSVILWVFRCLCGESESPALLYPSFGGPKNADAR
jgi:hypothetical protein